MKIGLLLPRSILYPALSFDVADGLKAALRRNGITDTELVSENIDLGTKDELIYAKAESLILAGTEVVAAYINPKSAEFIQPLFENSGALLLSLDSGYHYPASTQKRNNSFYISLQGSLCCRIAARIASENGSKNFAYACSLYDAGYRSGVAFSNSINDRGGELVYNHVTALNKREFDLKPLLSQLQEGKADTVLASFCGDMTEDFLREAENLDLFSAGKVYGASFMAEEIWLGKMGYPGTDWTTVIPWSRKLDHDENRSFVAEMQKIKPEKANVFSVIAWEAGLVVASIINSGKPMHEAILSLEGMTLQSPRGKVQVNPETHFFEAPVYNATVTEDTETGKCTLAHIHEISFTEEERALFYKDVESLPHDTTSWLNAYACLDS